MPFTTISDNHEFFPEKWRLGLVTALVVTACSLGWMIASENWLFVAAAFGLLLLLVRPIEVVLGLYAFLISLAHTLALDNSTGPTDTFLRYVGLLAIFLTFGVGWLRKR